MKHKITRRTKMRTFMQSTHMERMIMGEAARMVRINDKHLYELSGVCVDTSHVLSVIDQRVTKLERNNTQPVGLGPR